MFVSTCVTHFLGKRQKTTCAIRKLGYCGGDRGLGYQCTVYPKKYAHDFCFAVLCCGYKLTDFPISIRLTSLALWQSNDCPSASKATPMNMDKYFMWIHYERLHNHNKAKHNKTVCIFLGIYCIHASLTPRNPDLLEYTCIFKNTKHINMTTIRHKHGPPKLPSISCCTNPAWK